MTYDGFTLAAVIAELRSSILGGRFQKIRQHNDTDITLEIRGVGHTYLLFFSVDAKFPRVYLTSSSASVPPQPPNFCMLLRKYLDGAFLQEISQVGMDRIMRLRVDHKAYGKFELIFELMGKHSNLILVNDEQKIMGAIKHVGTSVSRYRQVLPGREYTPPPGAAKIDPRQLSEELFDRAWSLPNAVAEDEAGKWLMNTFSGFGPFLVDEIKARVRQDGVVTRDAVREEVLGIAEMVRTGWFEPVFITSERGQGVMAYPMPTVQYPIAQQHPRASINEALDTLFRSLVTRTELEEEKSQLITSIRRSLAARNQTLKSIARTLQEAERAERYRELGELLLANLHAVEKGQKTVRLVDYFNPDMLEVDVELDEKLTPQQNAERYFKRYQKARDAVSTAESRRKHIEREINVLESALAEAESAKTVDALKSLREMLIGQDLLRQQVVHERHEEEFEGHRIRRIETPEGWEILYGENSQSNDYLTQRVAKPNDVWLHARSITGAHVVIRTSGHSGGVPRPVLERAAKIAAQNSDARHSSLVPIDHTLRKYVRKPRGSAPGFVIYRNEKTIDVNPKAS